jgi:hypothetical protein
VNGPTKVDSVETIPRFLADADPPLPHTCVCVEDTGTLVGKQLCVAALGTSGSRRSEPFEAALWRGGWAPLTATRHLSAPSTRKDDRWGNSAVKRVEELNTRRTATQPGLLVERRPGSHMAPVFRRCTHDAMTPSDPFSKTFATRLSSPGRVRKSAPRPVIRSRGPKLAPEPRRTTPQVPTSVAAPGGFPG